MPKKYIDNRGWKYQVMSGLGENAFKARYQRPGNDDAHIWSLLHQKIGQWLQAEKDGRLLILPDARYTDSDGEEALRTAMWTCGYKNNPVTRYTADAIAEKLCREAKDENPPLTLEELLEMDGEEIYTTKEGWIRCWGIGDGCFGPRIETGEGRGLSLLGYGDTWLAYRHEPKGGDKRK